MKIYGDFGDIGEKSYRHFSFEINENKIKV